MNCLALVLVQAIVLLGLTGEVDARIGSHSRHHGRNELALQARASTEVSATATKQFRFTRTAYALVSGVGVRASYNVQGYCGFSERTGSSSSTTHRVRCFASGKAAHRKKKIWSGQVKVYDSGNHEIGSGSFRPLTGASITDASRDTIGELNIDLGTRAPHSFKVRATYVIDTGHGISVPMGTNAWHVVTI